MLLYLLLRWALIAVAFAITASLLSGMDVSGGFWGYLWVSALFGIVNAVLGTLLRIITLPLTLMGLTSERNEADGKRKDQVRYGIDFLYKNGRDADTILIAARSANILLTLLFAAAVAWWTRRRYGPAAGYFSRT